ncbi:MAG TPA: hypothetical protein VLA99_15590 [Nitrospiraceae bacterium]|nr:hypothetical protein [Nitrospiraceae bacterium]
MRIVYLAIFSVCSVLLINSGYAISAELLKGNDGRVSKVLRFTGVQRQIHAIPGYVLAGFDRSNGNLASKRQAVVRRVITQAFDADQIERRVTAKVSKDLSKETAGKIAAWLQSDLGRKISALEERGWTASAKQIEPVVAQLEKIDLEKLEKDAPQTVRLKLIRRLDHSTNATETLVDLSEASAFGAATVLDAARPVDQRLGIDRVRVQIDQDRPKLRMQSQRITTATFLLTYETLTDAELERYVEFLESDPGREYLATAHDALKDALYEASETMNHGLSALFTRPKG